MGIREVLTNTFIKLRQNFVQEALTYENDTAIPVNWVEKDGQLMAFFPADKTDFSISVEGNGILSLANAYVLSFVGKGDSLLVRYVHQPEFIEVTYSQYRGVRNWVQRFGVSHLHILTPIDFPNLKPGVMYGGEVTYWRKIDNSSKTQN